MRLRALAPTPDVPRGERGLRIADMTFADDQARQIFERVLDIGRVDLIGDGLPGDAGARTGRGIGRGGFAAGDDDVAPVLVVGMSDVGQYDGRQ